MRVWSFAALALALVLGCGGGGGSSGAGGAGVRGRGGAGGGQGGVSGSAAGSSGTGGGGAIAGSAPGGTGGGAGSGIGGEPGASCSSAWCWSHPLPQGEQILSIWADRTTGTVFAGGGAGALLRWAGSGWQGIPNDSINASIDVIWGSSATDVW